MPQQLQPIAIWVFFLAQADGEGSGKRRLGRGKPPTQGLDATTLFVALADITVRSAKGLPKRQEGESLPHAAKLRIEQIDWFATLLARYIRTHLAPCQGDSQGQAWGRAFSSGTPGVTATEPPALIPSQGGDVLRRHGCSEWMQIFGEVLSSS